MMWTFQVFFEESNNKIVNIKVFKYYLIRLIVIKSFPFIDRR